MKLPVTDASRVTAQVSKPKQSIGTILSVNRTPSTPKGFTTEAGATVGQKKLQLMLNDDKLFRKFEPVNDVIILKNNGDGTYSGKINDADVVGNYKVQFLVEGEHPTYGKYRRTETLSTMVRFGEAVLNKSDVYVRQIGKTDENKNLELHIRPKDVYKNYLGPDYGSRIQIKLSEGSVGTELIDMADGSYMIPLSAPLNSDPVITITILGDSLYNDKLSKLNAWKKLAISLHGGIAIPMGALADSFNSGLNLMADLSYSFSPKFSLVGYFGYNDFKSKLTGVNDNYWLNISLNAKYRGRLSPSTAPLRFYYLQAGPGYYIPENGNSGFGANIGAGFDYDYRNYLSFELGMDYHTIFSENLQFWHVHGGIILRF
jgi:hypothetical protein